MSVDLTIADVFARDGLQSLRWDGEPLSTAEKVEIIRGLDAAGVPEIEVTGFVHPRVVPNLADAEDVARLAQEAPTHATLRALVPNLRGAERAVGTGLKKVSCLIVASETYQRMNSNMSVDENLEQIKRIVDLAAGADVDVMVGMGMSFICPYEGLIPANRIMQLVERMVDLGIDEIVLADSIGLAWPALVKDRCGAILGRWPHLSIGLHLHTLAGLGLASALAGYEVGVRHFDASVGGVGGGIRMPVPVTAMSNVATEDLVYLFESSGVPTGIDAAVLSDLAMRVRARTGVGSGHVSAFGSLARFLEMSRARLSGEPDR
jgi:hydroxymethylglutaryl-CoA lyase